MPKASFQELIKADTPVLVDFYADWCQPCHALAPHVQQVSKELRDQLKVIKVDIDKNQRVAQQFGIKGVPTLILFRNGEVKWRQSGVVPAEQIRSSIQPYLN